MKRILLFVFLLASCLVKADNHEPVVLLEVKGAISPAVQDYIHHGLKKAYESNATVAIIRLDTPGGLDASMRTIIQDIIQSPIPVVVYVSPSGARAASAGTYMIYASHVAAMAPATNLGSATPVQIGGGFMPKPKDATKDKNKSETPDAMQKKVLNDAVAYIRSLAEMRGRNVEWAKQAVRDAANISAKEALANNVIDLMADNLSDLLQQLDGRKVKTEVGEVTIKTENSPVKTIEWSLRSEILSVITNPSLAYILLMIGIYGIIFELANPGLGIPGVAGAICILLAMYAFQMLPVNFAGLALLLLGIVLMVAEAFIPSFGILGIGGVVAFVAGSIMLFDEDVGFAIPMSLIITIAVVNGLVLFTLIGMAIKSHKKKVVSGIKTMLGRQAEVLHAFQGHGRVKIDGETWKAKSKEPLKDGQKVTVTAVEDLTVTVEFKDES